MDFKTQRMFSQIEKGFDIAACIPGVAIVSGSILAIAGKVQFLAGAVIGAIGTVGHALTNSRKWEAMMETGLELVIHGGLNVAKGVSQAALGTTLIGSPLVCIPFYFAKKAEIIPSFHYGIVSGEPTMNSCKIEFSKL